MADLVQQAGTIGLNAIARHLEANGAELENIVLIINATGTPKGEMPGAVASKGVGDERDLFVLLLWQAGVVGKAIGIETNFLPLEGRDYPERPGG